MFNEISSTVIFALIGGVTAILLYLIFLSWRNPVLAKLGLRSLARRPLQTALIVLGLTLSTIIVISALGTGDTLRYSVQRQSVAAYGRVDEIIAPPIISLLASVGDPNAGSRQAEEASAALQNIMRGGIDSVLALVEGGLPAIRSERLEQLRSEAAQEPLIDGVAGAIVFPTILRNTTSGASEPLGFIYAVDDQYPQSFGLRSVTGEPLAMDTLAPGVGTLFTRAAPLLAAAPGVIEQVAAEVAAGEGLTGTTALSSTGELLGSIAAGLMGASSLVNTETLTATGASPADLMAQLPPELAASLAAAVGLTDTAQLTGTQLTGTQLTGTQLTGTALAPLALAAGALATSDTMTEALPALAGIAGGLLQDFNLNTVGYDADRLLAQVGLQLRQGDLYLNRLGAQRLSANVGDVIEVYIGPVPVRFRVRAVVDEAGPLSALLPVVMLRLSEAQQLLFMPDRVNAVLVSNTGDEMTGMQHTEAVSRRLAVLALDAAAVQQVADILRRPDVAAIIENEAVDLPPTTEIDVDAEGDVPPLIAGVVESFLRNFNIEQMSQADVAALQAALADTSETSSNSALRELLARLTVRQWLLDLPLPDDAAAALAAAAADLNQFEQIDPLNKQTIVLAANVGGGIFSSVFSVFGVFSILAALLLIVLIFVMLAAERRVEIGVARAVGVQRSQIGQMFMTEGMVYNLLAGALGVLLGIGVTYAMTAFIGQLFNDATGQINSQVGGIFAVSFSITWQSVVVAYCLGVIITWLAMAFATGRVSRMNIVAAIRDLPDEAQSKRRSPLARIWHWLFPLAVTAAGGYLLWLAYDSRSLSLTMIALSVLLYGLTMLAGRAIELTPLRNETGYTIVYTLLGLGLLLIWAPPWYALAPQLAPDLFTWDPAQAPTVFTVGGPLIIVGAILVIMFNAGPLSTLIAAVLGFIPSLRPVLKTAIAYPLSTRFRTGMTMVLFAMIMATVVVMAVVINSTQSLLRMDPRETAGFELRISPTLLSFFSPVGDFAETLAAADPALRQQVAAVGAITNQFVQARVTGLEAGQEPEQQGSFEGTGFSGVNDGYVQQAQSIYHFGARAAGYADDSAVWEALRTRDDVVVIKPSLLATPSRFVLFANEAARQRAEEADASSAGDSTEDSTGGEGVTITFDDEGDPDEWRSTFRLAGLQIQNGVLPDLRLELTTDGQDGVRRTHMVQVIGVLAEDTNLAPAEVLGSNATLSHLRSVPVKGDEFFVKVVDGADAQAVAAQIEGAFVASGLNASVIADEYAQRQRLTGGSLQLLQGFMALGLLVGIAALGVVSARSVIERRQQVGMLRALGFQRPMVGLAFVLEASFISITGLLIGALTGVVLGGSLIGAVLPQLDLTAAVPWPQIGWIVLAAYGFSLLTTLIPAWQAARIYPAEALRYE